MLFLYTVEWWRKKIDSLLACCMKYGTTITDWLFSRVSERITQMLIDG